MTSLNAHFVRPDDHDRLPFHAECPRCRTDRLEGPLSDGPIVPLRTQAAIAAGVLAFTAVAPSATSAADGDVEGTAPPGQLLPDMESEGELDAADEAAGAPVEAVPDDTAAPVTEEPENGEVSEPGAVAPTAPEPEPEPEAGEPVAEVPESTESGVAEPAGAPAAPGAAPASEVVAPAAGNSSFQDASRAHAKAKRMVQREIRRARQQERAASNARVAQAEPAVPAAAPAKSAPAPAAAAPAAGTTPAAAPTPGRSQPVAAVAAATAPKDTAKPGDKRHVVQRGESLWSIAADVLSEDASPARIAREVNRLWELNKSRIGTGDPNLLHAGTELRLT